VISIVVTLPNLKNIVFSEDGLLCRALILQHSCEVVRINSIGDTNSVRENTARNVLDG